VPSAFRTAVVKRSALAEALPVNTAKVARDERTQQMRERFDGIRQRYVL
jgi:hypothetical protein